MVVEALLTGTPVVCSNVSALAELITPSNGILCENNVEDWVRGLKQAINSEFDRKQIAIDVKNKYDKKNIGIAINTVYQELV